ncbi:enterobactin transporter EntS, partial [Salmonella enterica subsp. enterica serovar Gaminara]|nr:enterobactin transporter EntS [Salmonella enterica subsp. enterica serovar Gaminara]
MNRQSWLLNLSLLKTHPAFRAVFLARFISIVSLGLLGVAVPVQIQMMTHSTWQVGLSVTLTGGAMFIGLMVGGVLADRYERKKVILLARGTCGIGFIGLCVNALLPEPSLLAIYLLGLWDGFFASLGVTALLAATPALVGRENLMQAGAITMLTVRLGSVISPMLGGILLASGGVAWNYGLAAAGTFITLLPLLTLPRLPVPPQPRENPFIALLAAFRFLLASPLIGGIALLGGLVTMASAVRVLYPALAMSWQMSAAQIGLLYAAIPLGAAIGALTSGQLAHSVRPGLIMLVSTVGSFLAVGLFAIMPVWIAGVICLALFGWLSA